MRRGTFIARDPWTEELFQDELRREGRVTGCGGYGTLLPFVFCILAGGGLTVLPTPLQHTWLPDGLVTLGSVWILAGQVNLYRRVNQLWMEREGADMGEGSERGWGRGRVGGGAAEPPLHVWWALLPPPLDVVVGLRQVHFLARYWTEARSPLTRHPHTLSHLPSHPCENYQSTVVKTPIDQHRAALPVSVPCFAGEGGGVAPRHRRRGVVSLHRERAFHPEGVRDSALAVVLVHPGLERPARSTGACTDFGDFPIPRSV